MHSIPLDLGAQSVHVTQQGLILVGKHRFTQEAASAASKPQNGYLAVYEPGTYTLLREVEVGLLSLTIRSSEDGKTAFVANIFSGTVSVVDLGEMKVVRTLDVDTKRDVSKKFHQGAHGMAIIS